MIKTVGLNKSFGELKVLNNINLEIEEGKITSIIGASGAGKSTLLQIMGTLDQPDSGKVYLNEVDVFAKNNKAIAQFRNQSIGFVFQFHHLLPEFTALENVLIPSIIGGKDKKKAKTRALELLDYLKLTARIEHKPSELSGGEQQRVAIARALINQPQLILADEPSGNLDSNTADELHQLFIDVNKTFKTTFVVVTHNKDLAQLSHRVVTMKDGEVIA